MTQVRHWPVGMVKRSTCSTKKNGTCKFCLLRATVRSCLPEKYQHVDNKMRMSAPVSMNLAFVIRIGTARITLVSSGPGHFRNKHPNHPAYMTAFWAVHPPMGDSCMCNHLFKDLNKWKPVETRKALGEELTYFLSKLGWSL